MKVRENKQALLDRLPRLKALFVVTLALIGGTYWFAQVVRGASYRALSENNRLKKVPVSAPRGLIYDRHGELLVDNVPSYNLLFDRSQSGDMDRSLSFAASITGHPKADLESITERHRGSSRFRPILLAENLSLSEVARFGVAALEHPEFSVEVRHLRLNRHGPLTAHIVGYLSEVSEADLVRSQYRAGDLIGKNGVENTYDLELRGERGERVVVVDSRGRTRQESGKTLARPGRGLELTIDLKLQQEAARYFEERVGAAVAMDPRNGEIRVLVSAPSFNPNVFTRRLDQTEWRALVEAPNHPLQNRAIQNVYAPGSVFKIVMAVAGLSERAVVDKEIVYCGGSTRIYNRRFRCWKRSGHDWVGLRRALVESCDVYFYHLGQKLGIDTIARYARLFGLGETTGIDIPGEKSGLVPDPAWKLQRWGEPWYPGETISVAIGQGPVLVTPLQVASLLATVANDGYRVTPHLGETRVLQPPVPVEVDRQVLAFVRDALWGVVNEKDGTGATAKVAAIDIAGKTGTAQVVRQATWMNSSELPPEERDHAWFAAYGSVENPELVVVVFVEHGGKGSQAAAPLAKHLYETYFRKHRDNRSAA